MIVFSSHSSSHAVDVPFKVSVGNQFCQNELEIGGNGARKESELILVGIGQFFR